MKIENGDTFTVNGFTYIANNDIEVNANNRDKK